MKQPILYYHDGTQKEVNPENGTDFQLDELYKMLNCEMIEAVYLPDDMVMVIDEEGKFKNHSGMNRKATEIFHTVRTDDWIVGNALVCHLDQFQ